MNIFKSILLLLTLSQIYSSEGNPVLSCLLERQNSYSFSPYKKVVQISPSRTGSTLVFNVLKYLFEPNDTVISESYNSYKTKVSKFHQFQNNLMDESYIYVVTLRDPVDAIYSECKIFKHKPSDEQIDQAIANHVIFLRRLKKYQMGPYKFLVLKYEEFIDDFDFLFSQIENAFNVSILNDDKIVIKNLFSKENMIKMIEQFNSFFDRDKITQLHGNHINNEQQRDTVLEKRIIRALKPFKKVIESIGYTL